MSRYPKSLEILQKKTPTFIQKLKLLKIFIISLYIINNTLQVTGKEVLFTKICQDEQYSHLRAVSHGKILANKSWFLVNMKKR